MSNSKGGPVKNSINVINSSTGRVSEGDTFTSVDSIGNAKHLQPARKKAVDPSNVVSGLGRKNFQPPHDLKLQSQEKKAGDR